MNADALIDILKGRKLTPFDFVDFQFRFRCRFVKKLKDYVMAFRSVKELADHCWCDILKLKGKCKNRSYPLISFLREQCY